MSDKLTNSDESIKEVERIAEIVSETQPIWSGHLKAVCAQARANAQGEAVAFREEVCAVLGEHIDTEDSRIIDAIEYLRSQCREPAAPMPDSLPDEHVVATLIYQLENNMSYDKSVLLNALRAHMGRKG